MTQSRPHPGRFSQTIQVVWALATGAVGSASRPTGLGLALWLGAAQALARPRPDVLCRVLAAG